MFRSLVFKNINRVEYKAINLETIQKLAEAKNLSKVSVNDLIEAGFISSNQLVKVLGNGSLTTKLDVEANAFSKSAVAAIEAVGGNAVKTTDSMRKSIETLKIYGKLRI